jgi:EmrB/QacA subfamily drug resistance transporter
MPTLTGRRLNLVFTGLLVGNTMAGLDATIVATAGLSIQRDLGSIGSLASIFTAYQLAQIATMPLYGKLGDIYGRRRIFGVSVAIFLVGSVLCGLAPSLSVLVLARVVQGAGAGGLTGLTMAIVADIVPPDRLHRYLGYTGLIFAVTSVLGPFLGGVFADELSWRWAFFVNLPSGAVCFVALSAVPRVARRIHHRVDVVGALLLALLATSVTLVCSWGGRSHPWGSVPIVGLTTIASATTIAFLLWERRVEEPIIPRRIFARPAVTIAVIANLIAGVGFFGGIVYLPVFFQSVQLRGASEAGRLLIPFAFATAMGTAFVGQVIDRRGRGARAFPIAGMMAMALGFACLSVLAPSASALLPVAFGVMVGIGIGFVMQVLLFVVQRCTEERDRGAATAVTILARIAGSVVGVAIGGNVLNQRLASALEARGSVVDPGSLQGDATSIRAFSATVRQQVVDSYDAALGTTFRVFVPIMLIGVVLTWLLPRDLDRRVHTGQSEQSEQSGPAVAEPL